MKIVSDVKKAVVERLPLKLLVAGLSIAPIISVCDPVFAAPNDWLSGIIGGGNEEGEAPVKVKIEAEIPDKWVTVKTDIKVNITDENNTGRMSIIKIEARKGEDKDSPYEDITGTSSFSMDENGIVYVKVTEEGGKESEAKFTYDCFDLENPTINAGVDGELLYVSASDSISGVKAVYVNDVVYDELTDGMMTINLKDYESTAESITLKAKDNAGNTSKVYKVKNPYYTNAEYMEKNPDLSRYNSKGTLPSEATSATGTVTDYSVTETEGENGFGSDKKEFYTIRTDSDKTFYLVVDKSSSQDNVYLLTEVNENDLLNFVNYSGDKVELGDVPLYTLDASIKEEVAKEPAVNQDMLVDEVAEPNNIPVKTQQNKSNWIVILLAVGGVGVYYIFKKRSNVQDYADSEDEEAEDENQSRQEKEE